jgi:Fe-S-cluster containining protein
MASVLEMIPLALDIYRTGDEDRVMDTIAAQGENPTCVMFQPGPNDPDKGRCSRYAMRPLVCRLFGFAARHDKHGHLEFAGCGVMNEHDPHAYLRAEMGVKGGLSFPVFQDFFMQVASQDPHLGYRMMPINQALREALEYLYWKRPRQIPKVDEEKKLAG